jgi:hypothetical protein
VLICSAKKGAPYGLRLFSANQHIFNILAKCGSKPTVLKFRFKSDSNSFVHFPYLIVYFQKNLVPTRTRKTGTVPVPSESK